MERKSSQDRLGRLSSHVFLVPVGLIVALLLGTFLCRWDADCRCWVARAVVTVQVVTIVCCLWVGKRKWSLVLGASLVGTLVILKLLGPPFQNYSRTARHVAICVRDASSGAPIVGAHVRVYVDSDIGQAPLYSGYGYHRIVTQDTTDKDGIAVLTIHFPYYEWESCWGSGRIVLVPEEYAIMVLAEGYEPGKWYLSSLVGTSRPMEYSGFLTKTAPTLWCIKRQDK